MYQIRPPHVPHQCWLPSLSCHVHLNKGTSRGPSILAQFGQHIFINKNSFMTIWALDNVECWNVEEVNCAPVISSMWTPQALQLLKIEKSCNVPDFSLVSQGSLYAIVHQFEGRFYTIVSVILMHRIFLATSQKHHNVDVGNAGEEKWEDVTGCLLQGSARNSYTVCFSPHWT